MTWSGTEPTTSGTVYQNALAVNGETGNVGINTATPAAKLDVAGDIRFSGRLYSATYPSPQYPLQQRIVLLYRQSVNGNQMLLTSQPSWVTATNTLSVTDISAYNFRSIEINVSGVLGANTNGNIIYCIINTTGTHTTDTSKFFTIGSTTVSRSSLITNRSKFVICPSNSDSNTKACIIQNREYSSLSITDINTNGGGYRDNGNGMDVIFDLSNSTNFIKNIGKFDSLHIAQMNSDNPTLTDISIEVIGVP